MIKIFLSSILFLVTIGTSLSQTITDTIKNEKKSNLKSEMNSTPNSLPLQFLNPVQKKVFGKTEFPLNLQIYSRVFANDFKPILNFSSEELSSGLSDEELLTFSNNKSRLQKTLSDFYGDDLINIEKLLESVGLTKEQVIALAAMLKFIFAQGILAAPI